MNNMQEQTVISRICTACKLEKLFAAFSKTKKGKYGLQAICKECDHLKWLKYSKANPEKLKVARLKWRTENPDYNKNWRLCNAVQDKITRQTWRDNHPDYDREWAAKNPARHKIIHNKANRKYASTHSGKINHMMSTGIGRSLGDLKAGRHWETIVGYTLAELMAHIEARFLPGMTWENRGLYGWHIDHIIPKAFFIFQSDKDVEFQYCWSLINLQPLWAHDNISKGNKVVWAQ